MVKRLSERERERERELVIPVRWPPVMWCSFLSCLLPLFHPSMMASLPSSSYCTTASFLQGSGYEWKSNPCHMPLAGVRCSLTAELCCLDRLCKLLSRSVGHQRSYQGHVVRYSNEQQQCAVDSQTFPYFTLSLLICCCGTVAQKWQKCKEIVPTKMQMFLFTVFRLILSKSVWVACIVHY